MLAKLKLLGCVNVPSHSTKLCGKYSVCVSVISTWKYLQNLHRNILFHKQITSSLRKPLRLHFFLENMFSGGSVDLLKTFLECHGGVWK